MTPDQFDAQQTAGNLADAGAARWVVAILVGLLAAGMLAALVVAACRDVQARRDSRSVDEFNAAMDALSPWWPEEECDGSYLCVADEHTPGCFADGYSKGDAR